MDLAELRIKVNSKTIQDATKALDSFGAAAVYAEAAVSQLNSISSRQMTAMRQAAKLQRDVANAKRAESAAAREQLKLQRDELSLQKALDSQRQRNISKLNAETNAIKRNEAAIRKRNNAANAKVAGYFGAVSEAKAQRQGAYITNALGSLNYPSRKGAGGFVDPSNLGTARGMRASTKRNVPKDSYYFMYQDAVADRGISLSAARNNRISSTQTNLNSMQSDLAGYFGAVSALKNQKEGAIEAERQAKELAKANAAAARAAEAALREQKILENKILDLNHQDRLRSLQSRLTKTNQSGIISHSNALALMKENVYESSLMRYGDRGIANRELSTARQNYWMDYTNRGNMRSNISNQLTPGLMGVSRPTGINTAAKAMDLSSVFGVHIKDVELMGTKLKRGAEAGRSFSDKIRELGRSVALIEGPLGGVAGRIGAFASLTEEFNLKNLALIATITALVTVFTLLGTNILRAADNYRFLKARVQNTIGDLFSADKVMKQIAISAGKTGADLETAVQVFQRASIGLKDLGKSPGEILNFSESIQMLSILSGASPMNQKAGLIQLSQALSSELVRAEEFNSVLENIPYVAQKIAESMGVTVGQLRKMVVEGELASKKVFEAINKQAVEIRMEFEKMPLTIPRAFNMVQKEFILFAAEFDRITNITGIVAEGFKGLANSIRFVTDNLETILGVLGKLTVAATTFIVAMNFSAIVSGIRVLNVALTSTLALIGAANSGGLIAAARGLGVALGGLPVLYAALAAVGVTGIVSLIDHHQKLENAMNITETELKALEKQQMENENSIRDNYRAVQVYIQKYEQLEKQANKTSKEEETMDYALKLVAQGLGVNTDEMSKAIEKHGSLAKAARALSIEMLNVEATTKRAALAAASFVKLQESIRKLDSFNNASAIFNPGGILFDTKDENKKRAALEADVKRYANEVNRIKVLPQKGEVVAPLDLNLPVAPYAPGDDKKKKKDGARNKAVDFLGDLQDELEFQKKVNDLSRKFQTPEYLAGREKAEVRRDLMKKDFKFKSGEFELAEGLMLRIKSLERDTKVNEKLNKDNFIDSFYTDIINSVYENEQHLKQALAKADILKEIFNMNDPDLYQDGGRNLSFAGETVLNAAILQKNKQENLALKQQMLSIDQDIKDMTLQIQAAESGNFTQIQKQSNELEIQKQLRDAGLFLSQEEKKTLEEKLRQQLQITQELEKQKQLNELNLRADMAKKSLSDAQQGPVFNPNTRQFEVVGERERDLYEKTQSYLQQYPNTSLESLEKFVEVESQLQKVNDVTSLARRNTELLGNAFLNLGEKFSDVFVDAITEGEVNWKRFSKAILADMVKIVYQMTVMRFFEKTLSVFTGFGKKQSAVGAATSIAGSVFSALGGGGLGGALGATTIPSLGITAPTGFAKGGVLDSMKFFAMANGGTGVAGEAGPEAILPLKRNKNGDLGVLMTGSNGGGGSTFNIQNTYNITRSGGEGSSDEEFANNLSRKVEEDMKRTVRSLVTEEISEQQRLGGILNRGKT